MGFVIGGVSFKRIDTSTKFLYKEYSTQMIYEKLRIAGIISKDFIDIQFIV